jgi:UDP-N-acetylglucosamine 2-epimerase (non-hydrolysing)
MKIVSIVGARPNFIKMAPVSEELRKRFEEVVVHTGQHYDYEMDRIFFDELGIAEPNYHLDVGSGSHGYQTGEILKRVEQVLFEEKPDLVLVFGDTNSTLSGALVAIKLHIKVAHVEAGLRSYDKTMPEEVNRVLTDLCSDLLFCPTETSVNNLRKEGIVNGVHLTGDVMVDALNKGMAIARKKSRIMDELSLQSKKHYLATVHRAENTDNPRNLKSISEALCEIGETVFPCHPRTEKYLRQFDLWNKLANRVKIIKPVGYFDMLILESEARKIITDSGGVQKEAYILKVPCITLRNNTEWVETVEDGWNVLCGADRKKIIALARGFEPTLEAHTQRFGNGEASKKIAEIIEAS